MGRRLHYFRGVPVVWMFLLKVAITVGTVFCARNLIADLLESASASAMSYFVISISEILQFATYSLGGLNQLLNVVLNLDFAKFDMFFPAMQDAFNYVILPASLLVVVLVLVTQIMNALVADFMPDRKTDNIFHLILLSIVAVPLVAKIKSVYQFVILPLFGTVYNLAINFDLSGAVSGTSAINAGRLSSGGITPQGIIESFGGVMDPSGSFYSESGSLPVGDAGGGRFNYFNAAGIDPTDAGLSGGAGFDNVSALGYTFAGNGLSFLVTFCSLILFFRYLAFLFRVMERYVWVFILGYFSPLGMSCIASVNTRQVTSRYWSMIKSSLISLGISVIMVKVISHGFLVTFMNGGTVDTADSYYSANPLVFKFVAAAMFLGILEITKKIDNVLNQMGLVNSGMAASAESGLISTVKAVGFGVMHTVISQFHPFRNARQHREQQQAKLRQQKSDARMAAADQRTAAAEAAKPKEGGAANEAFTATMGADNPFVQTNPDGSVAGTDTGVIANMQGDIHSAMEESPQTANARLDEAMEQAQDIGQQIDDVYADWQHGVGSELTTGAESDVFKFGEDGHISGEDRLVPQFEKMAQDMGIDDVDGVIQMGRDELAESVRRSDMTGEPESINQVFKNLEAGILANPTRFDVIDRNSYPSMTDPESQPKFMKKAFQTPAVSGDETSGFTANADTADMVEQAKAEQIKRLGIDPAGRGAQYVGNVYDKTLEDAVKDGNTELTAGDLIQSAEARALNGFANRTVVGDGTGAMDQGRVPLQSMLSPDGTAARNQFITQAESQKLTGQDGSENRMAQSLIDQSRERQLHELGVGSGSPIHKSVNTAYEQAKADVLANNPNATAADVIRNAEGRLKAIYENGSGSADRRKTPLQSMLTPDGTPARDRFIARAEGQKLTNKDGSESKIAQSLIDQSRERQLYERGVKPNSPLHEYVGSAYKQAKTDVLAHNPNATAADVIRNAEGRLKSLDKPSNFRTNETATKEYNDCMKKADVKNARDVIKNTYGFTNQQVSQAFEHAGQNLYSHTGTIPSATALKNEAIRQADRMYHAMRAELPRINTPESLDYGRRPVNANATRYVPDTANGGFKDAAAVVARNDGTKDYMHIRPMYTISASGERISHMPNREMADVERQCSQGDNFVTTNKNADGSTTVYGWTSEQKLDNGKRFK